jgi:Ca-activated chloride channel family protein
MKTVLLCLAAALAALGLQFSSTVNLVEVYASVTDRDGRPVTGLTQESFEVYESDRPQTLMVFTAGQVGLSVAVALDRSFSMAGERLSAMQRATEAFLGALRPDDRAMLVGIGSRVDVLTALSPVSSTRDSGLHVLRALDAFGSTSLHDAVIASLDAIQPATGRRALVLLSDGVDRYSRASEADVIERARRGDVLVYPIALGKQRPPLFAELASVTGGRSAHVTDMRRLPETMTSIAADLREQYLLGYTPQRAFGPTSEFRSLRVVVKRRPDVNVRARPGYWTK